MADPIAAFGGNSSFFGGQGSAASSAGYTDAATQQSQAAKFSALRQKIAGARSPEDARKVAQEFESVFLSQMLQHMFAGVKSDGLFGGGQGEQVYRSFLYEQYGEALAENGGVGIADQLYDEIVRLWNQPNTAEAAGELAETAAVATPTATIPTAVPAPAATAAYRRAEDL